MMRKGLDFKILYTLLIAVSGIVLTIGAASALMEYAENLEVDNGAGDSSVKVTSSTGDSKIILEDQGVRTWSVMTDDGTKKLQIRDETKNKPRLTIKPNGNVGIGTAVPSEKLDVAGNVRIRNDANIAGDLNVDGVLTGAYIATLEATIEDLQTRLAALEGANLDARILVLEGAVPNISVNAGDISDNAGDISDNAGDIGDNSAMIQEHEDAIVALEEPPQGNPCNPDGDGVITPDEMHAYTTDNGLTWSLSNVITRISLAEGSSNSPMSNLLLDTAAEVNEFNGAYLIVWGVPACAYP